MTHEVVVIKGEHESIVRSTRVAEVELAAARRCHRMGTTAIKDAYLQPILLHG